MKTDTIQNAVIFCRSACVGQPDGEDGLASQEARCREYAAYKRYNIVQIFCDEGISGAHAERPGVRAMLSFLKDRSGAHPFFVIIDDVSRLARSHDTYAQLTAAIRNVGGRLESPSINFSQAPGNRLDPHMLANAAASKRSSKWTSQ